MGFKFQVNPGFWGVPTLPWVRVRILVEVSPSWRDSIKFLGHENDGDDDINDGDVNSVVDNNDDINDGDGDNDDDINDGDVDGDDDINDGDGNGDGNVDGDGDDDNDGNDENNDDVGDDNGGCDADAAATA